MESVIKLINEENHVRYDSTEDEANLIYYIMRIDKTFEDTVRPGRAIGDFCGCIPYWGTEEHCRDPFEAYKYVVFNNMVHGKEQDNLMKHRVISFDEDIYILPNDAAKFAEYLIRELYNEYISVYGVHLDKRNIHIHLGINTINRFNGKRFNVPNEKIRLTDITRAWVKKQEKSIENDICLRYRYEKYLGIS